jgi:hypothetical protein
MMQAQHIARAVAPALSGEARIIREQRERIEELEEEVRQLRGHDARAVKAMKYELARRLLGISPMRMTYLMALLERPVFLKSWATDVLHAEVENPENQTSVNMWKLRQALRKHGVEIKNLHGEGWLLTPEDKAKINSLLEAAS